MSPDPRRELRRLQDSPVFKTYTELRRMSMCYGMMDAKLAELQDAVRRVRCSGPARWSSYDVIESETMEVCQLLADFLSRMYSCKNLASVMAKRHGIDREFRALKHDGLGFEASVVVNLRNYVVHVDMMPLEIDVRGRRTRRRSRRSTPGSSGCSPSPCAPVWGSAGGRSGSSTAGWGTRWSGSTPWPGSGREWLSCRFVCRATSEFISSVPVACS